MKGYGNSFVSGRESINASRTPLWLSVDETYPGGCVLTGSKGTVIPAGTAVKVTKPGGAATVYTAEDSTSSPVVTGLLLEDVTIGEAGATGTVVTKGQYLASRGAALAANVRAAVEGRISFVEGV